jgi:molybdate transport system regulatory protein
MPSRTRSPAIAARAKVWLESDGEYVFGLGISKILKAVDQEGSIKAAAAVVGKSYRHIWTRIKEAERALGVPLVATTVGGNSPRRSALTREAQTLVAQFDRLRDRVFQLVEEEFATIVQAIRSPL